MDYNVDEVIAEYGITVETTGYKQHAATFADGESFTIEGIDAEGAKMHAIDHWEERRSVKCPNSTT